MSKEHLKEVLAILMLLVTIALSIGLAHYMVHTVDVRNGIKITDVSYKEDSVVAVSVEWTNCYNEPKAFTDIYSIELYGNGAEIIAEYTFTHNQDIKVYPQKTYSFTNYYYCDKLNNIIIYITGPYDIEATLEYKVAADGLLLI